MKWPNLLTLRLSKSPANRSTEFAWLTYRAADGAPLRIFKLTRQPVDTEVTVRAIPYTLMEVGTQDLAYSLRPGDHYFRLMNGDERTDLVELRLKAIRANAALKGMRMAPTADVRARLHRAYSTQLVVAKYE